MIERPGRYVLRTVLIVSLGGFLLGFDASVISARSIHEKILPQQVRSDGRRS